MESSPTPHQTTNDEIDLIEVIRHIWNGRWLIAKITLAFMVLGLVIAFTTTEQYKAEARLLPEINDVKGGASALLKQFGGLGGLNLPMGEGTDAIRPELYPDVLQSTPFYIALMNHLIHINSPEGPLELTSSKYVEGYLMTGFWHFMKKYTIGLPYTLKELLFKSEQSNPNILQFEAIAINESEYKIIKILKKRINAGIDQKSGVISISAEFPDRFVAAQIADFTLNYLTRYITEYRTGKVIKELEFTNERYNEKKQDFLQTQNRLALFRDSNQNIISAKAKSEEQLLLDQYNLAFNVYNSLAQQLEQARLKVQEETPVMQIIEPVQIPVLRSTPKRGLLMFVMLFLGVIVGVTTLFAQHTIKIIRRRYI